jgi:hypothetical protein
MPDCHNVSSRPGSVLILQADGDAVFDAPGNVALWSTNTSRQTYAVIQLAAHGWGPDQFGCLNSIWVRESGWNELAGNPARAYGIWGLTELSASSSIPGNVSGYLASR